MKDIELIELKRQLKAGKNVILKAVFENYYQSCIDNLKFRTNASDDEAHDIFIDALMNFREKVLTDKLDNLSNLGGYINNTCYNMYLVRDKIRKRNHSKMSEIEFLYYQELGEEDEYKTELAVALKKAWKQLNDRCRKILQMFYTQNLSMNEISDHFDLSGPTVAKTTKSRCLKKLREASKDHLKS